MGFINKFRLLVMCGPTTLNNGILLSQSETISIQMKSGHNTIWIKIFPILELAEQYLFLHEIIDMFIEKPLWNMLIIRAYLKQSCDLETYSI